MASKLKDYFGRDKLVDFDKRLLGCLKKGQNDEAKLLLRNARNFHDMVDSSWSTLLHYSARYGNTAMVLHLIGERCDVNALDDSGFTPLMLAVQNGDVQTVRVLLENNADVFTRESTLKLAFQLSVDSSLVSGRHHQQLILEMIFTRVNQDDEKRVATLLRRGDDLEKLAAVVFGNTKLAELVLKEGYPVDFREPMREFTALHCAVIFAKIKNAKLLINNGADVTAVNSFRWSPLHYYTRSCESVDRNSKVLKLLLRGNIDSYLPNQWGFNEAEYLLKWGNKITVDVVLEMGLRLIASNFGRGWDTEKVKIAELLLQYGASTKILASDYISSLWSTDYYYKNIPLFKTILADFALKKSPLTELHFNILKTESILKNHFDSCTQQLEKMKNVVVYGTVTLHRLLTKNRAELVAYARNQDLILAFDHMMTVASDMEPYYYNTLKKRVADAIERAEFETKVASVIKVFTGFNNDVYDDIVCQIISYLELRDLNNLCRAETIQLHDDETVSLNI